MFLLGLNHSLFRLYLFLGDYCYPICSWVNKIGIGTPYLSYLILKWFFRFSSSIDVVRKLGFQRFYDKNIHWKNDFDKKKIMEKLFSGHHKLLEFCIFYFNDIIKNFLSKI
jgi:hypothetical protein